MEPTSLQQVVIEFLNSASHANTPAPRCDCGAMMEKRKASFHYQGQSWEIELPVCPSCTHPQDERLSAHSQPPENDGSNTPPK